MVKIQRVCLSRFCGDRSGSSLTGYVRKGNSSKRRLIGCGVVIHGGEDPVALELDRFELNGVSDVAQASRGIAQVHATSNVVFENSEWSIHWTQPYDH